MSERQAIIKELLNRGWQLPWYDEGVPELTTSDYERQVTFSGTGWILGRFTDSDVNGVAVGRYETVEEGEGLEDLLQAIGRAA